MKRNFSRHEIAGRTAIKSAPRRVFSRLIVAPSRIEKPQEAGVGLPVVVGRVVRSPKYGRGYVAETEDNAVRVRFWRHGYKTFRVREDGYPFDLTDEVRPLKTPLEIQEDYCQHGENQYFCCKCAGLGDIEIEQWKEYWSNERRITRKAGSKRYIGVRISRNDCVCTSPRESKVSKSQISDWYECLKCGSINEIASSKGKLAECTHCLGPVILVVEPFQIAQFSPRIHDGAGRSVYADAEPIQKPSCTEAALTIRDLYAHPNSRFQEGGTGYLRIPLDEPRSTRADAPEWLHRREDFFKTFKASRAARAEQIFCEFYLGNQTDRQIGETLGWRKDSVKKERAAVLRSGNRFFGVCGSQIPP